MYLMLYFFRTCRATSESGVCSTIHKSARALCAPTFSIQVSPLCPEKEGKTTLLLQRMGTHEEQSTVGPVFKITESSGVFSAIHCMMNASSGFIWTSKTGSDPKDLNRLPWCIPTEINTSISKKDRNVFFSRVTSRSARNVPDAIHKGAHT